jgi:hypothetical protein
MCMIYEYDLVVVYISYVNGQNKPCTGYRKYMYI